MVNILFIRLFLVTGLLLFLVHPGCRNHSEIKSENIRVQDIIQLPSPSLKGEMSLEEALSRRRSVRQYKNASLALKEISQLLWAAQGITARDGGRTAPSAGALYPLEIYFISGNVDSLRPGVYHYNPADHRLELRTSGDQQAILSGIVMQASINRGAGVIVLAAEYKRTTRKYGERGIRYVQLEAGHAAQNICLQAVALNIGTVTIGSFSDSIVKRTIGLPDNNDPLYLIPVGRKRNP